MTGSLLTVPSGTVEDTFRNRGATSVAIEFTYGSRVWRADTIQEAIELRKHLESDNSWVAQDEDNGEYLPASPEIWTPDIIVDLMRRLGGQHFLKLLYEVPRVTSDIAKEKLKLGSEVALAGVLSGLSKQLKKAGLKPSALYNVEVEWKGKDKTRTFRLAQNFRWAADELGWPDKWS
jgi:hypothetical protein